MKISVINLDHRKYMTHDKLQIYFRTIKKSAMLLNGTVTNWDRTCSLNGHWQITCSSGCYNTTLTTRRPCCKNTLTARKPVFNRYNKGPLCIMWHGIQQTALFKFAVGAISYRLGQYPVSLSTRSRIISTFYRQVLWYTFPRSTLCLQIW